MHAKYPDLEIAVLIWGRERLSCSEDRKTTQKIAREEVKNEITKLFCSNLKPNT